MARRAPGRTGEESGPWVPPGYTTLREVAEAGDGRVVLAVRRDGGDRVAIRFLPQRLTGDPAFMQRIRREAPILETLRAPYLLGFVAYVESSRGAAIVTEASDGPALADLLAQSGATGPEAALTVLHRTLEALAAAHMVRVLHRGVAPGAVAVGRDGSPRLGGFGFPAAVNTPEALYVAPEKWSGEPHTPATDLYAATCVFFQCLTGEPPYPAASAPLLQLAHESSPIPAHAVPEPLRPLLLHGMAKRPEERPETALAFLAELEMIAGTTYGVNWADRGAALLADQIRVPLSAPVIPAQAGLYRFPDPPAELMETPSSPFAPRPGDPVYTFPGGGPERPVRRRRKGAGRAWFAAALLVAVCGTGGILLAARMNGTQHPVAEVHHTTPAAPRTSGGAPAVAPQSIPPDLTLLPAAVAVNGTYTATATGFQPGEQVVYSWSGPTSGTITGAKAFANTKGTAVLRVTEGASPGSYVIHARGIRSGRTARAPLSVTP